VSLLVIVSKDGKKKERKKTMYPEKK